MRLAGRMGWTPAALWEATLPEVLSAWRGHLEAEQRADFRAGQIAAIIANVNRDPDKRPEAWTAADFFSTLHPRRPDPEPTLRAYRAALDALEERESHETDGEPN